MSSGRTYVHVFLLFLFIQSLLTIEARKKKQAALNMNCLLTIPLNPFTAKGLSTPFQLSGVDPANNGPCNESVALQAAFVQGAIIDTLTGNMFIYNPVVVDMGTTPAAPAIIPVLPANPIVAFWFGFNGNTLTLQDTTAGQTLQDSNCVNGVPGGADIFGQFSYCNAPAFFGQANLAIAAGLITIPPLGMANDGMPCPTVRDWFVVDMDQSDNVLTSYLVVGTKIAQNTAANLRNLAGATPEANGSDNKLLAIAIDNALQCTPYKAPDLADLNNPLASLPLNELHAAARQAAPQALVPLGDPMARSNGQPSLQKVNHYRVGVNQPIAVNGAAADTFAYCNNMYNVAPYRIQLNRVVLLNANSADPAAANSLYTFLAQRFVMAFGPMGLGCTALLNVQPPITVTFDAVTNVALSATITPPPRQQNQATVTATATAVAAQPVVAAVLSTTNIIIIACVVGGVLLLAVIIAVIILKRKSGGNKRYDNNNYNYNQNQ